MNLNDLTQASPPGTTFWLAPGTHTLGTSRYDQVIAKPGNVYIGGPGAIVDGQDTNVAAFTGDASHVTIRYLTVERFAAPDNESVVNQGGAASWTIERNTIRNNTGAAVKLGDGNVARHNCLTGNRQYAVTTWTPAGTENITLHHNELAFNATHEYGAECGCSGATKFWAVRKAIITQNWVHHNEGPGLWADMNNVDFLIEGNYLNDNDNEAIFYEISYNAVIRHNTLKRNALVKGRASAARNDPFPVGAIYISESGGDAKVSPHFAVIDISGNLLENNWGGVVLWEDPDRFCNTASPSPGYCPIAGVASLVDCVPGKVDREPFFSDCRWRTMNVRVHDNEFRIDRAALACVDMKCGQQALFSTEGTTPAWSPYKGDVVPEAVTFRQNNRFENNRYEGEWHFTVHHMGTVVDSRAWMAAPYSQDVGSSVRE